MKKAKKVVCLIIVLCLILNVSSLALAASPSVSETVEDSYKYIIYDSDGTLIESYQLSNGDIVVDAYQGGVLAQRNTIYSDNKDFIERQFFDINGATLRSELPYSNISIRDYIAVEKLTAVMPMASHYMGTINYRTSTMDAGTINYGLRCSYVDKNDTTTYTIKGFLGNLVDLVSLLVGAIALPFEFVSPYVTSLLAGLGISVLQGVIMDAVTDTVSCIQTTYTWTLQDTTVAGHNTNVESYKYFVTDTKSAYTNKTYYEGVYQPKNWGEHDLAVFFHFQMFAYDMFDVVSWT